MSRHDIKNQTLNDAVNCHLKSSLVLSFAFCTSPNQKYGSHIPRGTIRAATVAVIYVLDIPHRVNLMALERQLFCYVKLG